MYRGGDKIGKWLNNMGLRMINHQTWAGKCENFHYIDGEIYHIVILNMFTVINIFLLNPSRVFLISGTGRPRILFALLTASGVRHI